MTDQCRLPFIAVDVVAVAGLFLKYQRRIFHGHVVVTCFCRLFLVIVSEQFLFVQATILNEHDVKWSFFIKSK